MNWIFEMGCIKRVHFVGIGGAGMAGIAEVLLRQGYMVSGSDLIENALTRWLSVIGATIYCGHDAKYVREADVMVRSSAIREDNVELQAARDLHIPIVPRAEMLGELMRFRYGIAIAGTHGKTTTTSLIASILAEEGIDPTFVIGGCLKSIGSNARLGRGHYLVAEADESDTSFLYLNPVMSLVTNIDQDHMGTYQHDFEELKKTFLQFLHRLPFYGLAVLCIDDPVVQDILPTVSRRTLTYGFHPQAAYRAYDSTIQNKQMYFTVQRPYGLASLRITLNLQGKHNILNALGAIAVASALKVKDCAIVNALKQFAGIDRRFQIYGEMVLNEKVTVTLVDDYGHHPREIIMTLRAVRETWPGQRLVMVYQLHRYTRTRDLFKEFCEVLTLPDQLFLLNVYAAGEDYISGADSQSIAQAIAQQGSLQPILVQNYHTLPALFSRELRDGDILLMQGAGDIGTLVVHLAASGLQRVHG